MNKILILTTEGCEACDIAKSKVEEAILKSYLSILLTTFLIVLLSFVRIHL